MQTEMVDLPSSLPMGLLISGGLDSSILAGTLLARACRVQPFYVRSGLIWEDDELRATRRYLKAIASPRLGELVILDLPIGDLYGEHWSTTGCQTPGAASPDEAVYLPGRNALLLLKAAVWCQLHDLRQLALGVLGSNPFADARSDFFDSFQAALNCTADGKISIVRPFAGLSKRQVMDLGRDLPLELTFSCIAPAAGLHCGQCNKCAERNAAFRIVHRDDPTQYAVPLDRRSGSP